MKDKRRRAKVREVESVCNNKKYFTSIKDASTQLTFRNFPVCVSWFFVVCPVDEKINEESFVEDVMWKCSCVTKALSFT